MLTNANTMTKLTAFAFLVAGGTLAGLLAGWNVGPMTLDVSRGQSGWLGAGAGLLLAAWGCCFASERSEAHARRLMQARVLKRLIRIERLIQVQDAKQRAA
jgi:hypothetical protein